jgi:hypothetical protein
VCYLPAVSFACCRYCARLHRANVSNRLSHRASRGQNRLGGQRHTEVVYTRGLILSPGIELASFLASNWEWQRPSSVQNRSLSRVFSATQPRKGNRVIETYGAGDGNRTQARNLESF